MSRGLDRAALLAALAWQIELGADEATADAPTDWFAALDERPARTDAAPPRATDVAMGAPVVARPPPAGGRQPAPAPSSGRADDPAALAAAAESLAALARVMEAFDGSPLKQSARRFVFADGHAGAELMVIGEAPGGDEDRIGRPFVGVAGQLLDRMLAAIGRARSEPDPARGVYITNILPWRPPGNRTPTPAEAALFLPFVHRHIALARPRVVLALGNTPVRALIGTDQGIRRIRGTWARLPAPDLPVMPSFHPAYLLRQPSEKRLAWRDLLAVEARLAGR